MASPDARQGTAFETAALLLLAAEHNNSPAGALLFDDAIRCTVPPTPGSRRAMLLLSRFDDAAAVPPGDRPPGSALAAALTGALRTLRTRSLVFVISDFRVASGAEGGLGWEQPLSILAVRHDVAAVVIQDPTDWVLPKVGLVPFADTESPVIQRFPTNSTAFRTAYRAAYDAQNEARTEAFLRHNASPLLITTADDPAAKLQTYFSS
jgi:uncharacterized protein (DUF58 family)